METLLSGTIRSRAIESHPPLGARHTVITGLAPALIHLKGQPGSFIVHQRNLRVKPIGAGRWPSLCLGFHFWGKGWPPNYRAGTPSYRVPESPARFFHPPQRGCRVKLREYSEEATEQSPCPTLLYDPSLSGGVCVIPPKLHNRRVPVQRPA